MKRRMLESKKEGTQPAPPAPGAANPKVEAAPTAPTPPPADTSPHADAGNDVETPDDDADGGEHDDSAQDMELIKKMLDERLGPDNVTEDDVKACHEAMKCAMAGGEPKESAMQMAGHSMKMAKYMASAAPSQPAPGGEAPPSNGGNNGDSHTPPPAAHTPPPPKEANRRPTADAKDLEIVKLRGELAAIRESSRKATIATHLEKVCRESGLPMSVTKLFKDIVGVPRTVEEIDSKMKAFKEGVRNIEGGEALDFSDSLVHPEAGASAETASAEAPGFSDCTID